MASRTYSLWLMPQGAPRDAFAAIIDDLAARYGGPRFTPHITLLGSVTGDERDIIGRAEQVAQQIATQTVAFEGIGLEDVYFRSLYAIVRPAPALTAANEAARRVFGKDPPEPFMPHLSLFYGLDPPETKQAMIRELDGRLPASTVIDAVEVYLTEPPVESWRLIRRLELRRSNH
jgi:2'-5' RNA ligase